MKKLFIFIFVITVSCSTNPDKIFEESVKKYISGNKNARYDIETSMIKSISFFGIEFSETEISPSSIFTRNSSSVKFLYPENFKIKIKDAVNYENFQTDLNKTHAVFILDGIIHLYKKNGNFVKDIAVPDKDGSIKIEAVIFYKESLLYYSGGYLYLYSSLENKNELLISEKLNQQLKGLNRITMQMSDGKLFLCTGIGGAYNINIIDIEKRNFITKNLPVSSSRIYGSAASIKYIDGGSGQWRLMEMTFSGKNNKVLTELKDVIDIEFFEKCAVIEGKNSISIFDYNKTIDVIPFDFELGGSSAGELILIIKDRYYAVSAEKLMDRIKYLKQNAPGLFVK
jgi:hypothetical protein